MLTRTLAWTAGAWAGLALDAGRARAVPGAPAGKELPAWAAEIDCTSWAQLFLELILGHPHVTCPIPATSKPAHLDDNMRAGRGRLPDARIRERMYRILQA